MAATGSKKQLALEGHKRILKGDVPVDICYSNEDLLNELAFLAKDQAGGMMDLPTTKYTSCVNL